MKEILGLICALALATADPVRTNIASYDETDPKQAPIICATPNSDGILIAHENCNQFYQCWDGKPIARHCYGTLQYNPAVEVCDWPHLIDCGERAIAEDGSSDHVDSEVGGESDSGGNNGGGAGNCDPSQAENICASAGSDGSLVAHENCNEYYVCVHGLPVVKRCSGNLLFDPFKDYCDWPENVDCGDRVICEENDDGGDTENEDNDNNGNTGAGNCDPSQAGNICAAEGSDGTLVAHKNCNKYFICEHGFPFVQKCPGILLFDPFKDYCDWPDNVDCGERLISEDDCDEEANETGSGNNDNNNSGNGNSESDNGNNGSTGAGNCDPSQAGKLCAAEGSDGTLVAHESCNKYFVCNHGLPVVQRCPGALLFDPFKDYCDWPDNVDCENRIISEDDCDEESNENGSGSDDNNGVGNGNSESDSGNNGSTGAGNCDPSQAENICAAEGSEGTLVAHDSCNKYFICNHGLPIVQKCPGTLLFDPFKDYCDWPENVDCGDRVILDENSEEINNGDDGNENDGSENGSGTCNCSPGEAPAICAVDGSDGTFVAHENCNQFYTCAAGVPVAMTCPGTTLYNPYTDQCDWPDNVECGDRVIPEEESEENNNENGENGNGSSESGGSENGGSDNSNTENGGSSTCNCNPGEAPAICSIDGSEGTFIAHENCNKYYTCAAGAPVTMPCPGTTLYNPYTEQCDWPDNVECGDRVIPEPGSDENNNGNGEHENGGSDNDNTENGGSGTCNCNPGEAPVICAVDGADGIFVAHENCNQFYTCAAGVPVAMTCPGTTLYNPYTDQCDWPDNVECGDRVIPEKESEENNNENGENGNGSSESGGSENGGSDNGNTENGGSSTCNCNPGEAPAICSIDGSEGTFIAHENCNKYYTCAAGAPVTMPCPGTTLYNPYTEQCDWPDNVECGDRVIPEPGSDENNNGNGEHENGGSDNDNTENGGSGTCNCNPGEAPVICAVDGADGIFVAHENCNQFYTCAAGVPVAMTCPGTTLYNPYTDQCDWPDTVECGDRVIPEPGSDENNNGNEGSGNGGSESGSAENGGSDNGNTENGGSGSCNCNPGEAPAICAVEGSDGEHVAHENCNQFYTCVGGQTVTQTCPSNTLYNPYFQICDWPNKVECDDRVIPEAESEENNNGNGENENGGSESSSSENGGSENSNTENGGSGTCNCNPVEAPAICSVDGSDGTFIAHENCNKYYTCVAGAPVTMPCPGTTLYNPYTEQCDWPDNVECGDRVIPEPGSDENNNGNGEHENGGSDNDNTENGGSGTCNCNPGEAPVICAVDGADGIFVAHENCNQFYTCAAGVPVAMTCPGTTLYNPYTDQCDWPDTVECGDRVIPEPGSDENNNENEGSGNGGSESGSAENGGSDNGNTENGGSGSCNCNPGEAPAICAVEGSDGAHVAHENCNQFYTCVGGQTVTQTCPGTTLYNPYSQICDWPDKVECDDRVIPEAECEENNNGNGENENGGSESSSSENGGSENGNTENGGSSTCNCNPVEAPAICSVDGSDGIFIAHENCNKYYTCVAGAPVTMPCPGTTLYNPYTEQCDWPDNVECGDRVIPEPGSDENNNGNEGSGNEGSESGSAENGGSDNGNTENGSSGSCNCNPGEAPAICAVEGSDGAHVAHENCNQFYTCVGGQTVTQTCPGNTLYNPYSQICDWPDKVECDDRVIPEAECEENNNGNGENENGGSESSSSENGGSENGNTENGGSSTCNCNPVEAPAICSVDGSDGTFIAHENCNKYYTCVAGAPVTMPCPGTTLYNPYTEQCDWPDNVECGDRVIPEPGSDENNNGNEGSGNGGSESGSAENGGSDNGNTENGGSGSCNCNPGEAPAICAVEGSDGAHVAHENCNQFYTCVGGQTVTQTCPGTTLYNPYSQICDWPDKVECDDRVIPEAECEENNNGNGENENGGSESSSSENGSSENGNTENGGSGTCNCKPVEAPAICSVDGSDGTFIAHENCNKYYTCVAGAPVTMLCPGTTLYNPYTEQCDWPDNVECGDRVIPEPGSDESNNGNEESGNGGSESDSAENGGSDNGNTENGGSGSCNCNPGEAPAICAVEGSDGAHVAHENCNQFYTCVGGQTVTQTCPGTTLYNPYSQICDWPDKVECDDRVIPEAECEENNNGNGEIENGGSESSSSENGGSDNGNTENGGSGSCNCNPGDAPAICAVEGSDGAHVAHENCNQFYTCVGGQTVTQTCPGNTLYNPYFQICDWPDKVECDDRVIPEAECEENNNGNGENENGGSESSSSENGGSDNGNTENGGSGSCNCNPGDAPAICAVEGSDGAHVAHENCNQFYTCVGGQTVIKTCPGTTLYNPYTEVCDWPNKVECGNRIISEGECEENNNGNGENGNGGTESTETGGSDIGGSDNGDTGTCNCNPGDAPAICATEGSDGAFIAHQHCNKFYTCVSGEPVTLTCPGITLYNPYTQRCDWPENISCGDRSTSDENSNNDSADESGQENKDENESIDADPLATCEKLGSEGLFLPHEQCNQFYVCIDNKPLAMNCSSILLYNHDAQKCDWPEHVDCGSRIIPSEESEVLGEEADDVRVVDILDDSEGEQEEEIVEAGHDFAVKRCAETGSANVRIPHEQCHRFYMCVSHRPVVFTCTSGNLFDIQIANCNFPTNVNCDGRIII